MSYTERTFVAINAGMLGVFSQLVGAIGVHLAFKSGTQEPLKLLAVGIVIAALAPCVVVYYYGRFHSIYAIGVGVGGGMILLSFPFLGTPIIYLCMMIGGVIILLRSVSMGFVAR